MLMADIMRALMESFIGILEAKERQKRDHSYLNYFVVSVAQISPRSRGIKIVNYLLKANE